MSADSPKRPAVRSVPAIVPPQVVSDRSLIDSVTGFINDVTLSSPPQIDPKEQVQWVKFENMADVSDPTCGEDWELEGNVPPPLIIMLGFGSGVKVYALPAHGEAHEVLGWRHGIVRALRVLPTPFSADDDMANEPIDQFIDQRPVMALCDNSSTATCAPYCSASFVSLKNGAQVKVIRFKNPILDILANRTSIVITFQEKIAVFDARNFEDRFTITSCHPSPGTNPNPIALGARWMAYSEWKLLPSKRSSGGCDCEGVSSYTATVLNAAKSLGKGLRELGEQVAAGLTGGSNGSSASSSKSGSFESNAGELRQSGLVTVIDIKYPIKETSPTTGTPVTVTGTDPIIAHFIAHSDAIVALEFDPSGMILLTADKRGHDFHIFRIQPHPAGSHLASVHHLYILHRGDTSAKIQDIAFSLDSRWVAISSLRGTTHVFPITPYGGQAGVRTHGSLHVVNRLSRFHRSAGLTVDGRSSSPILYAESACNQSYMPYNNPRTPPFPRPVVVHALAQIRQPSALGTPPGSAQNSYTRSGSGRQRLTSLSDDTGKEMRVCAVFAKPRSWLLEPPGAARESQTQRMQRRVVDSLFLIAGHGALIQYDLDVKLSSNVARDRVCDDAAIELEAEPRAQWYLGRRENTPDIQPPLPRDSWLLKDPSYPNSDGETSAKDTDELSDRWLSQVEIITHAGPHRRLWMGPQFVFKTYNTPSGSPLSHIDSEAVEIGLSSRPNQSSPMNITIAGHSKDGVPVLIESGSYSSIEQSPKFMDRFRHGNIESDFSIAQGDSRLKEDLADAMRESPSVPHKDTGLTPVKMLSSSQSTTTLESGHSALPKDDILQRVPIAVDAAKQKPIQTQVLIEKVVNPLGTVTTITRSPSEHEFELGNMNDFDDDYIIHENCDEALFRPVVAIFCDEKESSAEVDPAHSKPPEAVGTKLIVPVIELERDSATTGERGGRKKGSIAVVKHKEQDKEISKFDEMTLVNRKTPKSTKKATEDAATQSAKEQASDNPAANSSKLDETGKQNSLGIASGIKEKPAKNKCLGKEKSENNVTKNTQNDKTSASSSNVAAVNLPMETHSHIDVSKKKPAVIEETTKASELREDAGAVFESILTTTKKVVEKTEKVLTSAKKVDKSSAKNGKKGSAEDTVVKAEQQKQQSVQREVSKDINEAAVRLNSKNARPVETKKSQSPEPKATSTDSKNKKLKDKNLVTAQEPLKCQITEDDACPTTLELNFYEKFTESDVCSVEIEDFPSLQKVHFENLEYPSLSAAISEIKTSPKKAKNLNVSPKRSPQKSKKVSPEKRDIVAEVEVYEKNISLSPKKKSKKSLVDEKESVSVFDRMDEDVLFETKTLIKSTEKSSSSSKEVDDFSLTGRLSETTIKRENISSQISFELVSPDNEKPAESDAKNQRPLKFDELFYESEAHPEAGSLINFESPVKDEKIEKSAEMAGEKVMKVDLSSKEKDSADASGRHKYTKENLIFALCGSLHEGENVSGVTPKSTSTATSDEHCPVELDEQYLSLEPILYHENTPWTSSSDDTEENSRIVSKKQSRTRHHGQSALLHRDDDEELRPLIDGTNSACSITSSISVVPRTVSGGKRQESTEDDENSAIALEIAKAISDSLPDNNSHSDSSDPGNALPSSDDLDFDMPSTPSQTDNGADCPGPVKKPTTSCIGGSASRINLLGSINQQTPANTKKKSRRKKR